MQFRTINLDNSRRALGSSYDRDRRARSRPREASTSRLEGNWMDHKSTSNPYVCMDFNSVHDFSIPWIISVFFFQIFKFVRDGIVMGWGHRIIYHVVARPHPFWMVSEIFFQNLTSNSRCLGFTSLHVGFFWCMAWVLPFLLLWFWLWVSTLWYTVNGQGYCSGR